MTIETIRTMLGAHPWSESLIVVPEIGSTNTALKELAAQGAPSGTVFIADRQTGGRGRLGRSFASPAGLGLYFSLLLRPQIDPSLIPHATLRAGLAAAEAIEVLTGLQPGIKWPNDLVIDTRKLCGILAEAGFSASGRLDWLIIGIGINVGHAIEDFPPELQDMATSLAMLGHAIPRETLAAELMRQLQGLEADLSAPERYLPRYEAQCITLHQDVQLLQGSSVTPAYALGIAADGGLRVRLADGSERIVGSGEVSVRGLYGYVK